MPVSLPCFESHLRYLYLSKLNTIVALSFLEYERYKRVFHSVRLNIFCNLLKSSVLFLKRWADLTNFLFTKQVFCQSYFKAWSASATGSFSGLWSKTNSFAFKKIVFSRHALVRQQQVRFYFKMRVQKIETVAVRFEKCLRILKQAPRFCYFDITKPIFSVSVWKAEIVWRVDFAFIVKGIQT